MIGTHWGGLREGQVVITGSLNGLPFIDRPSSARGAIDGLGTVEAVFPD
jgi:2-keto-4-pentenoate hydratase